MLNTNKRGLVRISVSGSEPLTLAETKLYLRADGTVDDSLITDLITVSREHAEHYLKRSIVDQQWQITLEDYAPHNVRLPMGPVRSIVSVQLLDADDNATTVATSQYKLKTGQDEIEFDEILYAHRVQIDYQTGYINSADMPKAVRYGMLSHLTALYDCRGEGSTSIPKDALALYSGHKEVLL